MQPRKGPHSVPQDPWRPARVVENRRLARGSVWLTLESIDGKSAAYEPGHVLGVALINPDGSLQRHAYTVSTSAPERQRFSHLYRVIPDGQLTPRLEHLCVGDSVYFHGPFHTPIQREIDPSASRIVGVATGTGIGPLYGFAVKELAEREDRPIALYASFRKREDAVLLTELKALAKSHVNFSFAFSLTDPSPDWTGRIGRVQDVVPACLAELDDAHIHLVGRGEMVNLWRQAWLRAGFASRRVSTETYFNHHADPDHQETVALAQALQERA